MKKELYLLSNVSLKKGADQRLSAVSLRIYAGETAVFLGKYDSGVFALSALLGCTEREYDGDILYSGKNRARQELRTLPTPAREGIFFISEKLWMTRSLSVGENILLQSALRAGIHYARKKNALASDFCRRYGLEIDASKRPEDISYFEQICTAVICALYHRAEVLLLDRVFDNLTWDEASRVRALLRRAKDEGCAVLIFDTSLREYPLLADRTVILRNGRIRGDFTGAQPAAEVIAAEIEGNGESAEAMRRQMPSAKQNPDTEQKKEWRLIYSPPGGLTEFFINAGDALGILRSNISQMELEGRENPFQPAGQSLKIVCCSRYSLEHILYPNLSARENLTFFARKMLGKKGVFTLGSLKKFVEHEYGPRVDLTKNEWLQPTRELSHRKQLALICLMLEEVRADVMIFHFVLRNQQTNDSDLLLQTAERVRADGTGIVVVSTDRTVLESCADRILTAL